MEWVSLIDQLSTNMRVLFPAAALQAANNRDRKAYFMKAAIFDEVADLENLFELEDNLELPDLVLSKRKSSFWSSLVSADMNERCNR